MIDFIIVCAYLLSILLFGLYYRPRKGTLENYSSVGSKIKGNRFILLATIFATSVGGGTTFGISEKVFSENLAFSYAVLIVIMMDILIAIYIIPKVVEYHGAITVGDIFYKFYGNSGKIIIGLASTFISIGYFAVQISISAKIFEYFFAADYFYSVILSFIVVSSYTTIGGIRSVIATDFIQFLVIIFAIPVLMIFGILYLGGLDSFIELVPKTKYIVDYSACLKFVLSLMFMTLNPTFIQRILINKDVREVQRAVFIKSFIYFFFIIIITIIGMISYINAPSMKASFAMPYLIDQVMPIGLKGFVISGFLASVMSTADSDLSNATLSMVGDVLKPILKYESKKLLLIARILTICISCCAILIALKFTHIVDLIMFVAGLWAPVAFVPFIMSMNGIFISSKQFIFLSLVSVVSFILWESFGSGVGGIFIGVMTSFITFSIIKIYNKL